MPAISMIFSVIGVSYTAAQLMHLIEWLDTPRTKKAPHPDQPTKANRV